MRANCGFEKIIKKPRFFYGFWRFFKVLRALFLINLKKTMQWKATLNGFLKLWQKGRPKSSAGPLHAAPKAPQKTFKNHWKTTVFQWFSQIHSSHEFSYFTWFWKRFSMKNASKSPNWTPKAHLKCQKRSLEGPLEAPESSRGAYFGSLGLLWEFSEPFHASYGHASSRSGSHFGCFFLIF